MRSALSVWARLSFTVKDSVQSQIGLSAACTVLNAVFCHEGCYLYMKFEWQASKNTWSLLDLVCAWPLTLVTVLLQMNHPAFFINQKKNIFILASKSCLISCNVPVSKESPEQKIQNVLTWLITIRWNSTPKRINKSKHSTLSSSLKRRETFGKGCPTLQDERATIASDYIRAWWVTRSQRPQTHYASTSASQRGGQRWGDG